MNLAGAYGIRAGAMVAALTCLGGIRAHADSGRQAVDRKANSEKQVRSPEARAHLESGVKLYRLRDFDGAIAQYKAGALLEDAPTFWFNLGQCYRLLGRYEEAIWHFKQFLTRAPTAVGEVRVAAESFIAQMRSEQERQAMRQPPMEPLTDSPSPPPAAIAKPEPWYRDGLGWGLAGSGTVAGAASLWLFLDARSIDQDVNEEQTQSRRVELREAAEDRRLAGTIIAVGGGLLLVAGVVKLAIPPRSGGIEVSVSPGAVNLTARF